MIDRLSRPALLLALTLAAPHPSRAADMPDVTPGVTPIAIDAARDRRPINPLIYGVNFATTDQLNDLNAPLNRSGGSSASLYNWAIDARNAGKDWFFESVACGPEIVDQHGDGFVAASKAAGAAPMLTIPMIGWVARLDEGRKKLASFSIGKYGLQENADLDGFADAGTGVTIDGTPISENDPTDAAQPDGPDDEKKWVRHLVDKWGAADHGGVAYYLMDNEPSYWSTIHRDVHPIGPHASEIADKVKLYSAMVKSVDPQAKVVAPEEWGWNAYRFSGFDQQFAADHGWTATPDRAKETKGMDYLPWLLTQWKAAGHPVDVVSVHFYPQGGEYSDTADDVSPAMQATRNRSTRDLWDPTYKDPTWINSVVALIPTLRHWVDTYYYPGTPIAITEYSWGGEKTMNGATAQADILGIFGREGLDMATRWITPATGSPTYLAMKLYRNYDDRKSAFGEVSVRAAVPDADRISAFAALRGADNALTIMVVNKQSSGPGKIHLALGGFAPQGKMELYQLADGHLNALPPGSYRGGAIDTALPAQSATLFVLHGAAN